MHICSVENFMNFSFNKKKPQWKLQKCLKSAECPMWQNDVAIILIKQTKKWIQKLLSDSQRSKYVCSWTFSTRQICIHVMYMRFTWIMDDCPIANGDNK